MFCAYPHTGSHLTFLDGGNFGWLEKVDGCWMLNNWSEKASIEWMDEILANPSKYASAGPTKTSKVVSTDSAATLSTASSPASKTSRKRAPKKGSSKEDQHGDSRQQIESEEHVFTPPGGYYHVYLERERNSACG